MADTYFDPPKGEITLPFYSHEEEWTEQQYRNQENGTGKVAQIPLTAEMLTEMAKGD